MNKIWVGACRKWRKEKERTGHGAFHAMKSFYFFI